MAFQPRTGIVRFFRGGKLLGITRHDGNTKLCEIATGEGIEIPTNCTSGNCGTCMVTLLRGDIPIPEEIPPGLDEDLLNDNARLACIGIPEGDVDIEMLPPL